MEEYPFVTVLWMLFVCVVRDTTTKTLPANGLTAVAPLSAVWLSAVLVTCSQPQCENINTYFDS
jgi:hypothetical protein